MVSSKGMLVNRLSTSKLAIKFLELNLLTSLANENESWTVYSFSDLKSYVGVPMADK